MDAAEIEALVKSGAEMPENLSAADCYYFLSLDYIRRVKLPAVEKERRYSIVRQSYENYRREVSIYQDTCKMRIRLAAISKEMIVHGCPLCKKAIAIFDERDKEV